MLAALLAVGCGNVGSHYNPVNNSHTLTVYSSLPLQGQDAPIAQQIVNGEKLALAQAGGRVGAFHVSFYSLDDSDPSQGYWTPEITSQAAREAAQDTSAIAYIGDFDSGATAISLPLINEAGILQVSPWSPYIGLTEASEQFDDKGEPYRYYPTGQNTFARLAPPQPVEAAALAKYMHAEGVKKPFYVQDYTVFDAALAPLVATAYGQLTGPTAGAPVQVDTHGQTDPSAFQTTAQNIAATQPDAVMLGAAPGPGAVALLEAVHAELPHAKLFVGPELATPAVIGMLDAGTAAAVYAVSPQLSPSAYPPQAQKVLQQYSATFPGSARPGVYALYGYEAMSSVLSAIRAAGTHGGDRRSVVRAYLHTQNRDSVLGRYSVTPHGDVTLDNLAGYRVGANGRLRLDRNLNG
jgi:branched-chain amino acid transport system substrate-binding protein